MKAAASALDVYKRQEKARTIGEMLAEARQRSGAQKLSGHDIMALERFDPVSYTHLQAVDQGVAALDADILTFLKEGDAPALCQRGQVLSLIHI